MKKVIVSFLCGVLTAGAVGVIATEYNIYPNPYKVTVNGREVAVEGYNINDKSYFQLRDIGTVAGFTVDFDAANETVQITSDMAPAPSAPTNDTNAPSGDTPQLVFDKYGNPFTTDGLACIAIDGVLYVSDYDIVEKLKKMGHNGYEFSSTGLHKIGEQGYILTDIPHHETATSNITLEYYYSTILPWINSLEK